MGNVLDEAPIKLANCVLLFCKGLGWLTSVNLPGIETRRQSQDGQVGPCVNLHICETAGYLSFISDGSNTFINLK